VTSERPSVADSTGDSNGDNTGGGPVPHQLDGETYPGTRQSIDSVVVLAPNGCRFLEVDTERLLVVWPRGTTQDREDATLLRLADGTSVAPGNSIRATAAVVPVSRLVGVPDGYWGSQLTFCAPKATNVLVVDELSVKASG
jgi:hypothetical protein